LVFVGELPFISCLISFWGMCSLEWCWTFHPLLVLVTEMIWVFLRCFILSGVSNSYVLGLSKLHHVVGLIDIFLMLFKWSKLDSRRESYGLWSEGNFCVVLKFCARNKWSCLFSLGSLHYLAWLGEKPHARLF
jgi:hypothetical protein